MARCLDLFPPPPVFADDTVLRAWECLLDGPTLDRASTMGQAQARASIAQIRAIAVTRSFWSAVVHLPGPDMGWRPWLDGAALVGLLHRLPRLTEVSFDDNDMHRPSPLADLTFKQQGRYRQGWRFSLEADELYVTALWRRGKPQSLAGPAEWAELITGLQDLFGQAGVPQEGG